MLFGSEFSFLWGGIDLSSKKHNTLNLLYFLIKWDPLFCLDNLFIIIHNDIKSYPPPSPQKKSNTYIEQYAKLFDKWNEFKADT